MRLLTPFFVTVAGGFNNQQIWLVEAKAQGTDPCAGPVEYPTICDHQSGCRCRELGNGAA